MNKRHIRVLWFNWRDLRNPDAGGAEVFTHEIARRLVQKRNYDITIFTATFPDALSQETIDGVKIIRDGGKYTVYNKAKRFYKNHQSQYDIIIDEINVKPFLTPKYVTDKIIIALIHQVSPEQFLLELPFPLSYIGYYYLEKKWLSYYKNILMITVSDSTRIELEKVGCKRVNVIPQGLSTEPLPRLPSKESDPTLVFIGRLKKHKRPQDAILAFLLIKKEIPDSKLWIIGDGYMRSGLEKNFNHKDISFLGYVNTQTRNKLISRAHLVLLPATREGWPLVVLESNSMGTPVLGYDVPGVRDPIKDGETSILVKDTSPEGLAASAVSILRDHELLRKLSSNALSFSKQFNWDISADAFDRVVAEEISRMSND
jgi:glycosyltransferase involved in cell wall biosynthesis